MKQVDSARFLDRLNNRVASSIIGRWFCLEGCGNPNERKGSRFTTEIRAGLTTWAALAYIIAVNASIISDSGGTCSCSSADGCANDATYLSCVNEVKRELITTTAAISALASFLLGLWANLPVSLVPGMGVNVYFSYSVVGRHGTGALNYREALAAVFMAGWLFLILSLFGLRQFLVRTMPQSLILATGAGIGLFITLVGLSSGGLNFIGGSTSTYISIGGCNPQDYIGPELIGYCDNRVLRSPTMWLGIVAGGLFTVILMMYRIHGAILLGILLTTVISWPRATPLTYFPHTASGDEAYNFFKKIVTFCELEKIGNAIEHNYRSGRVWYTSITFLYVCILDTTGAMDTLSKLAGIRDPQTLDFENSTIAYCITAFCTSIGALMGTSPVVASIESATGITEGGKTGLTAIITGILFFISIFFAPIFASIPPWATGGALVIVGALMIRNVTEINWEYFGDSVPAFLTLVLIPLTYNITHGITAGVIVYILLNGFVAAVKTCTGGRIMPTNYDKMQRRTAPSGSTLPSWLEPVGNGFKSISTVREGTK